MGRVYDVLTGIPFCIPGIHFGIDLINFTAAAPHPPPISRIIRTFVIVPSFSTLKDTYTFPVIPLSFASSGYIRFLAINLFSSPDPPGNSGAVSTLSTL